MWAIICVALITFIGMGVAIAIFRRSKKSRPATAPIPRHAEHGVPIATFQHTSEDNQSELISKVQPKPSASAENLETEPSQHNPPFEYIVDEQENYRSADSSQEPIEETIRLEGVDPREAMIQPLQAVPDSKPSSFSGRADQEGEIENASSTLASSLRQVNSQVRGPTGMRIIKRSSGGRGEYEISGTFQELTPRDLVDHILVLDLGAGLRITTGVRLVDRDGKHRLRIDASLGAEMQVHRQLAAALLMPYPARGETAWGTGEPVIEADRYGIDSIELAHVDLAGGIAVVVPERIKIAKRDREGQLDCTERMDNVQTLWEHRGRLPPPIDALLSRHAQQVSAGGPLSQPTEETVAELQRAAAAFVRMSGVVFSETHDAVPLLLSLLQQTAYAVPEPSAGVEKATQRDEPDVNNEKTPQDPQETTRHPDAPSFNGREGDSLDHSGDVPQPGLRAPFQPRRYQPPRRDADRRLGVDSGEPSHEQADRSCIIEVRFRNRIGGLIVVSLLPRRREGMPAEVNVTGSGADPIVLSALHESWYQDIIPPDLGDILRNGAAWSTNPNEAQLKWSLAGRDLYVLGKRDGLSGFVSMPRLVLGDEHIVLCTIEMRLRVRSLLIESCGAEPTSISTEDGLPEGWTGFRDIVPLQPIAPSPSADILNALRAVPELQICLRNGIRLRYFEWLAGFPPDIRMFGCAVDQEVPVTIDGATAVRDAGGRFSSPGWDLPGDHIVACQGLTRSYSIVTPPDSWAPWPAHGAGDVTTCGAMVGEFTSERVRQSVVVPSSNALLLGCEPGEVYLCAIGSDIRLGLCCGSPWFSPVWAVPPLPLQADKSIVGIIMLGAPTGCNATSVRPNDPVVRRWCKAILDCARKRLRLTNETLEATAAWQSYRDNAKSILRRVK